MRLVFTLRKERLTRPDAFELFGFGELELVVIPLAALLQCDHVVVGAADGAVEFIFGRGQGTGQFIARGIELPLQIVAGLVQVVARAAELFFLIRQASLHLPEARVDGGPRNRARSRAGTSKRLPKRCAPDGAGGGWLSLSAITCISVFICAIEELSD